MPTIDELKKTRIEKLEKLKKLGIDPYPSVVHRDQTIEESRRMEGKKVVTAGRIVGLRGHGKIFFADLTDENGKIQMVVKSDTADEQSLELMQCLDIGDFVSVKGLVGKTQAGEMSVFAQKVGILTKAVLPIPNSWYGFKDVEERYRKRYLDTILNPEVKKRIQMRSRIIDAIRDFLTDRKFLEVETPTLQPVYGGGFARPFSTHHNELDSEFYLRISDEMYLKRLIVGGFDRVFEITKVFRNEGVDHDHNPEFTMFEAQIAYENYAYGMDIIEDIIEYTALTVLGSTKFTYQGVDMDVKRPWARFTVVGAIEKYTGIDPLKWKTVKDAKEEIQLIAGIPDEKFRELRKMRTIGECIAFVFEEAVEANLIQPTIVYDYPIEISPLAKKCPDPRFTERFEMFAFGSELGNNYTELNDPIDLRRRFTDEKRREEAGFEEAHQTDEDYLTAIEHGFPPTCGIAIGIDRLVMLLTDAKNIKEVIPFPTLRPEKHITKQTSAAFMESPVRFITRDTYFSIDPKLKNEYPSVSVGIALIEGLHIKKSDSALEKEKSDVLEKLSSVSLDKIESFAEVQAYRRLYKDMGVDIHSRRPSPEALLRRIVLKKGLYTVNTCVDSYNLAVLMHRVSAGAFDADKITFPTSLQFAQKGETILLLGDDKETVYTDKEFAYYDQVGGYNLDFNYRDAQRTAVTEKTTRVLVNVDGIFDITPQRVEMALHESVTRILQHCGGNVIFEGVVV
jgi:lysyl-tRNA synthetase, class II